MDVDSVCHALDVTLDTNVLVYAANPADANCGDCITLLEWLRDSSAGALWVLDDHGKTAPDPATSVLYKEYRDHVPPQSVGMILLTHFLQTQRVAWSPRPDQHARKQLELAIPRNKSDRAIAGAALGSRSRYLVSNDLRDFPPAVRGHLRRRLGILVVTSSEAVA